MYLVTINLEKSSQITCFALSFEMTIHWTRKGKKLNMFNFLNFKSVCIETSLLR